MDQELQSGEPVRPVMAFDVGERRIGVAVTDGLGVTAQPLLTIYRKTPRADLKSVGRLLRKHGVAEAVVGYPLNLSGEAGVRARMAAEFAEALRAEFGVAVHLVDERLTTWEAHQLLDAGGRNDARGAGGGRGANSARAQRIARSKVVDQVAAVLILEGFLEERERRGPGRAEADQTA